MLRGLLEVVSLRLRAVAIEAHARCSVSPMLQPATFDQDFATRCCKRDT